MQNRTDLAIESIAWGYENLKGIESSIVNYGEISVTRTAVTDESAAKQINKPMGKYTTVDIPYLAFATENSNEASTVLADELKALLPQNQNGITVIGLGNREITPDALGPRVSEGVLATRHIADSLASEIGLKGLKKVSVISTGVLGQTGIETVEIIKGITDKIKPDAVIVIDALAAKSIKRLGTTVQISNVGISPGSGVGNHRKEISNKTLGVPVIAVGIPTVVNAASLYYDIAGEQTNDDSLSQMIVTPREIDTIIEQSALLLAHSINKALQPEIDSEILQNLV